MQRNIQQRIVTLRNELRAQKTVSVLQYGELSRANTQAVWHGKINLTYIAGVKNGANTKVQFKASFRRHDNHQEAPLVDFAAKVAFSPAPEEYWRKNGQDWILEDGGSIRNYFGEEVTSMSEPQVDGSVVSMILTITAEDYFDYYNGEIQDLGLTLTVEAISLISGELAIERIM